MTKYMKFTWASFYNLQGIHVKIVGLEIDKKFNNFYLINFRVLSNVDL